MASQTDFIEKSNALGPGARLKQARLNRNFGIDEIASKLRLSRQQVESIERDDYSYVTAVAYAKGHLRMYARMVDLSVNEVLKAFEALGIKEKAIPAAPRMKSAAKEEKLSYYLRKWSWLLVVVLILLLVIWWFTHRHAVQEALPAAKNVMAVPATAPVNATPSSAIIPLAIPPANNAAPGNANLAPAPQQQPQQQQPVAAPTNQPGTVNTQPAVTPRAPQNVDTSTE